MELLEPEASQLITRPEKDRQEKPVHPRRTLVVVEEHGVVVVGGGDHKARSLLNRCTTMPLVALRHLVRPKSTARQGWLIAWGQDKDYGLDDPEA